MTEERGTRESNEINRVELAGKITQIIADPMVGRFAYGVIEYDNSNGRSREMMLNFPPGLYIQENIVGKYMIVLGKIKADDEGDSLLKVEGMIPCTAKRTMCKERPNWWEGSMDLPGLCAFTLVETERRLARMKDRLRLEIVRS